jgi:hypothetical protein
MGTVSSASLRAKVCRHFFLVTMSAGTMMLGACASSGAVGHAAAASEGAAGLVVENNSWNRVTVYISRGGQLWRLGEVNALEKLQVPPTRIGFVTDGRSTFLVAYPLAGDAFRSEPFSFPMGGMAVWTIENQSGLSHVSLR